MEISGKSNFEYWPSERHIEGKCRYPARCDSQVQSSGHFHLKLRKRIRIEIWAKIHTLTQSDNHFGSKGRRRVFRKWIIWRKTSFWNGIESISFLREGKIDSLPYFLTAGNHTISCYSSKNSK